MSNDAVALALDALRQATRLANAAMEKFLSARRAHDDAEAAVTRAEKTLDAAIAAAKSGRAGADIINLGERRSPESDSHGA